MTALQLKYAVDDQRHRGQRCQNTVPGAQVVNEDTALAIGGVTSWLAFQAR
jgi:hypothetical protein